MLPLLLATSWLPLSGCCEPVRVPDERARPTLPVRPHPRATDEELTRWTREGRASLIVREVLRERGFADAMQRDGEWAR